MIVAPSSKPPESGHASLAFVGLTSLPLFFLANTSCPKPATPRLLTIFAQVLPTTAGINAMVKLNQMGASVRETSSEIHEYLLADVNMHSVTSGIHETFVSVDTFVQ